MKEVKRSMVVVSALTLAAVVGIQTAQADIIEPSDIADGSGPFTTTDTLVTLTPFAEGLVLGTFGSNGTSLFGITGGFNANSLGDRDGDPATTADREALGIALDATVGLSQFEFAWARSDGPDADDGFVLSGFLADPGATASGFGTLNGNGLSYSAGSLYVSVNAWSGTSTVIDLSSLAASAGQTLTLSANDSDQADPRLSMSSITYEVIPEPSTLALLTIGIAAALLRRRR